MSDRRTRELERAYAEDPSNDEIFRALYSAYKRYDPDQARDFVRSDMLASGEFSEWPRRNVWTEEGAEDAVSADYERASGQYVDPEGFMADGPERKIAAEQVLIDSEEFLTFSDGPYVLRIALDSSLIDRRMHTGANEEDFIPIWSVYALYKPWRGIDQNLHRYVGEARSPVPIGVQVFASEYKGLFAIGLQKISAFVDAPYYSQDLEGDWEQNAHGLLVESSRRWRARTEEFWQ